MSLGLNIVKKVSRIPFDLGVIVIERVESILCF